MEANTPTFAIAEYEPIAAALASVEKYRGLVCDVTTPKGMAEAKAAQREVGALRIALEKTRKKVKEDVVARGKLIDGEANRIFALIAAIEVPLMTQIDAEEDRVERERQAAIEAEQARLAAEERARKEAEERALAEARAKIEAERAELARRQAEQMEVEARARREREEAERASKQRIAEAEEKARKERQVEEDRIKAERDKVEAARRAVEEQERISREKAEREARLSRAVEEDRQRKAREAEEAEEREERRKIAERFDAQQLLALFVERYGHLKEFAGVVAAIKAYQRPAKRKAA